MNVRTIQYNTLQYNAMQCNVIYNQDLDTCARTDMKYSLLMKQPRIIVIQLNQKWWLVKD